MLQGPLWQTNATLLEAGDDVVLVDPAQFHDELAVLRAAVDDRHPERVWLLITHADFDHVQGIPIFPDATVVAEAETAERLLDGRAAEGLRGAGTRPRGGLGRHVARRQGHRPRRTRAPRRARARGDRRRRAPGSRRRLRLPRARRAGSGRLPLGDHVPVLHPRGDGGARLDRAAARGDRAACDRHGRPRPRSRARPRDRDAHRDRGRALPRGTGGSCRRGRRPRAAARVRAAARLPRRAAAREHRRLRDVRPARLQRAHGTARRRHQA